MNTDVARLRERREALLRRAEAERRELAGDYAEIDDSLRRADGWLGVARRFTPVAAVGVVALALVVGPGRIVRLLRNVAVPALLVREILGRSSGGGAGREWLAGITSWLSRDR